MPLLLVVLILVAGGLWAARLARPSPEAQIGQAAQRMSGQLDVLRVSHYTPEVVENGRVKLEPEYRAALEDLARARQEWQTIRGQVPEGEARRVDEGLEKLDASLRSKRPPEEVDRQVGELLAILQHLSPASREGDLTARLTHALIRA